MAFRLYARGESNAVFGVGERRLNEGVVGFVRGIVMSVLDKDIQRVCLDWRFEGTSSKPLQKKKSKSGRWRVKERLDENRQIGDFW
jgi:hypothetical protein